MKLIKSTFLSAMFVLLLSGSASASYEYGLEDDPALNRNIQTYLAEIDMPDTGDSATMFVNFLSLENGLLFSVDFLVVDKDTILIVSKTEEEEYYKVKDFNTDYVVKYTVPVMNIGA